jgi:hypothetical protein
MTRSDHSTRAPGHIIANRAAVGNMDLLRMTGMEPKPEWRVSGILDQNGHCCSDQNS